MVGGSGASLIWMLLGFAHGGVFNPTYPWGWQPMFPGLAVSAATYGVGILAARIMGAKEAPRPPILFDP
jgi:hypothetical protein